MKTSILLFALVLICLAGNVNAQTNDSTLLPEAQAAFDKGLAAAKQEEWAIAIRSFDEARKTYSWQTPAPQILFNQALAESHVPGRELRAIVLFKSYLASSPDSPKAAAVQEQIANLQIKVEGTMNSLLEQARDMTLKLSDDYRQFALFQIAAAKAKTGDIDGAKQLAFTLTDKISKDMALVSIAQDQAALGDFAGAESTAGAISSEGQMQRDSAFGGIIEREAAAGKIDDAKNNLRYCSAGPTHYTALIAIASAQDKAGQRDNARQTLVQARSEIHRGVSAYADYAEVGRAQADIDDIEGALETASLISAPNPEIETSAKGLISYEVDNAYANRVRIALTNGDIAAAKDSASHISTECIKNGAVSAIDIKVKATATQDIPPVVTRESVRQQQTKVWTDYLYRLDDAMYTDFRHQLQAISAKDSPRDIVTGFVSAVENIAEVTSDIKQTEADLQKSQTQ